MSQTTIDQLRVERDRAIDAEAEMVERNRSNARLIETLSEDLNKARETVSKFEKENLSSRVDELVRENESLKCVVETWTEGGEGGGNADKLKVRFLEMCALLLREAVVR